MKNITSFAKYILLVIGIILVSSLANAQYPHVFATLPGGNVPASYLDDNFNAVPSNVVKYTPSGGTPTTAVSKLNQYVNRVDWEDETCVISS